MLISLYSYVEQAYDSERVRVHTFDEQCGDCVRNLQNAAIDVEHMHAHSDQCSHDHHESKNMASVDSTPHVHSDQCRHGSKSDYDKASTVPSENSHPHSVPSKSQLLSQPHGSPASMASLASEVIKAAGPPAPECLGDARDSLFRFRKMLLAKRAMKPEEVCGSIHLPYGVFVSNYCCPDWHFTLRTWIWIWRPALLYTGRKPRSLPRSRWPTKPRPQLLWLHPTYVMFEAFYLSGSVNIKRGEVLLWQRV